MREKTELLMIGLGWLLLALLVGLGSHIVGAPPPQTSRPAVVISEFMAANQGTRADEDGDYSDWIEIHNTGSAAIDLNGWYLTDDDQDLRKWRFPTLVLEPEGRLLVFASGKNRAVAGSELHTNFRLDSSGEYLGLVRPDAARVAHEYAPDHPIELDGVFPTLGWPPL
jgi:hypothetical protein